MARLLGLFRASLGRPAAASITALYGLSALSGPFAAAPAVARSMPALPAIRRARSARHANAAQPHRPVRMYRDTSHIVMVGSIADICRKLDQAVGDRYSQIEG
ncbi:hypothetical protein PTE30175_03417 [Pandoraea terrae]|uniref:Uncharacterized protein n=1 Tax=Pandoraea terrae TaxID=1537710 RepID=A0A5E4WTX2_9BURK|nr:hypothetical protein [Pandoraea terrae]VVE28232.1 hypothetical protein PTE30175_03417 [Pandoraea terrae]